MDETTQPLAEIKDYRSLVEAARARIDELNISLDTVDTLAGFADRWTSKILSPSQSPTKRMGWGSLWPLLDALGLKLVVVENPETMERYRDRRVKRNASQVRHRCNQLPPPDDTAETSLTFVSCCTDSRTPHEGQAHAG